MVEFRAVLGGKVVSYPSAATFVIERKQGRKRYSLIAEKDTLNDALTKARHSKKPGATVRLSAMFNGRFKPLLVE